MRTKTSNKNNPLFNEDVKNSFLDGIRETTRSSYERIFKFVSKHEISLEKDINKFSVEEINTVLHSFKANNRNTVESYARIISSYLNWSVANGYATVNVLASFRPEDFERYLSNEEVYLSERKVRRYEDICENYQDAVIMRLLFIGVGGRQLSEIRNIKKSDINFETNQLKLINSLKEDSDGNPIKYTERYIIVDDRTMKLIDGALNQKTYIKKNGHMEEFSNIRNFTDLVDNDYLIRSSITKTDHWNVPVDKFVIYRRLQTLEDTLGVGLTTKFIQRSGMIYYANKLSNNGNNELTVDDLKIIGSQFNMKSYHNLKGFLTIDNIKKVYKQ